VVEQDYLLTNQHYRRPPALDERVPADALTVLWSVRPSFLQTALTHIEQVHGSLDRYLAGPMKLGPAARAQLKAHYLLG
jgi:protein-tyrosine phosphatase